MASYFHPARDDITLTGVLAALGDPTRLAIVRTIAAAEQGLSCTNAAPFPDVARSTLSNHFRVLRESGVIFMTKRGVENINTLRRADLDARFPGLLDGIIRMACGEAARALSDLT